MKVKAPVVSEPGNVFQQETRDAVKALSKAPIVKGVLVENVKLSTGTTRVSHGLGRPAKGWFVVSIDANQRVWRDSTDVANPNSILPLIATAAVTVSLWIF